ncbi:HalOD1 output domain-containing protein [Natrialbaceae archaeon GCM10025810]|uniref:HalOD1 output domain-containing protein n=1 Tax=Halovalidus salilacus TaxID=3075124 RepID=UPI003611A1BF
MCPPDEARTDEGVDPSHAVIAAVADADGVDVTDVEPPRYDPLYAVVDPDALDALFGNGIAESAEADDTRVAFEYAGYEVHVTADGVDLYEGPRDGDPLGRTVGE